MQVYYWIILPFVPCLLLRIIHAMTPCQKHEASGCLPPHRTTQQSDTKTSEMSAADKFRWGLLKRLGYDERPKSNIPVSSVDIKWLKTTFGIVDKESEASKVEKQASENSLETEIFFPSTDNIFSTKRKGHFLSFDLTDANLEMYEIERGNLRVYINSPSETIIKKSASHSILYLQFQVASNSKFYPAKSRLFLPLVSSLSNSMSIDLSILLKHWQYNKTPHLFIRMVCLNCNTSSPVVLPFGNRTRSGEGFMPALSLRLKRRNANGSRQRRAAEECLPVKDLCCRRSFIIKFSELGWDDWIIHPKSIDVGQCSGTCDMQKVYKPVGTHASLIRNMMVARSNNQSVRCCSPTKFSSIQILYASGRKIKAADLEDLIVEKCGCSF